ncbi:MAG: response regulator [Betaproteobacteria bacterium]|nr:response regulator [Betaproteobacteria bacterium]
MTPLRVLAVDDEGPARQRLKDLLTDCREAAPHALIGEAANGREALEIINQGNVDLVLMDIRMPVMDGIEAAGHLLGMEKPPRLIFTTAYDAYAIKAFELNAIDYLLKPIKQDRLLAALRKAGSLATAVHAPAGALDGLRQGPRKHLSIHERGRVVLIPMVDVLFLRAELKYVTVRTAEREFLLDESLTKLEEEFSAEFVRVHRNALVAKKAITGFEKQTETDGETHWVVLLRGIPDRLAVSRRQQHIVREF